MALKGARHIDPYGTNIEFFMNVTGERGIVLVHDTSGSGEALDQGVAVVKIPTGTASGTVPAGLLMGDVVNKDLTQTHLNSYKDEVQVGSKVCLLRKGWVVTNMITNGVAPTAGSDAYCDQDGKLRITNTGGLTKVGKFLSSKDEDGYAKVEINIV